MNLIKIAHIGYKPIPKVACTSIKAALYKLHKGTDYKLHGHNDKPLHTYWNKRLQPLDHNNTNFVVIRDPIKRFLSGYSNRVGHHKQLGSHLRPECAQHVPIKNPSLGQFIEFFEDYYKVRAISHHFQPTHEILEGQLGSFQKVFKIEQLDSLATFLSTELKTTITFRRLQTGGRKQCIQELNSKQLDFLIDFYKDDYNLLSDYYTIDDIWHEWKKGVPQTHLTSQHTKFQKFIIKICKIKPELG